MTDTTISVGLAEARLQATADYLDAGTLQLWEAPRPANGATPAGALLGEITLDAPSGTVASGLLELTVPRDGIAVASGNIGWARFLDGASGHAIDADVSIDGGGAPVQVASLAVVVGGTIRIVVGVFA